MLVLLSLPPLSAPAGDSGDLLIYSSRKEHLVKDILEEYRRKTGVAVRYRTGDAGTLIQLLKSEGKATPADLLLTVDAGNLWYAAREGLLAPVHSPVLNRNISPWLRDGENRWFGLSVRARILVYHTGRTNPSELSGYEALADKNWKGRLCLRTGKKVYNQSLVAMLIHELGRSRAKQVVAGWVANAAEIYSGDTLVLEALKAGKCDVGIVNSYYYGKLLKKEPGLPLRIFWPNQKSYGAHINVSGIGLIRHGRNRAEAVRLMEWLASRQAQKRFAQINLEYPVMKDSSLPDSMKKWGAFKSNTTFPLVRAGELQAQAIRLMHEVRYR